MSLHPESANFKWMSGFGRLLDFLSSAAKIVVSDNQCEIKLIKSNKTNEQTCKTLNFSTRKRIMVTDVLGRVREKTVYAWRGLLGMWECI